MDIGATTARAALANLDGSVIASRKEPTDTRGTKPLLEQLVRLSRELAQSAADSVNLITLAIGTPGVVDPRTHQIRYAHNLPALEAPDFYQQLSAAFSVPVSLHNDVNLAALGERWQGAGRKTRDFVFVSIGTGLGFGLILGGTLYQGVSGRAGEFGYTRYPGDDATLEALISGPGIAKHHRELGGSGLPEDAFREADARKAPGSVVIDRFLERLSWLLSALSTLLDPERIVLGGGIGVRCRPYLPTLQTLLRTHSPIVPNVLVSQLEGDAGLQGAISIALQRSRPLELWLKGGTTARTSNATPRASGLERGA
jgi:predicted NBD/HSP70 family sugar kinase